MDSAFRDHWTTLCGRAACVCLCAMLDVVIFQKSALLSNKSPLRHVLLLAYSFPTRPATCSTVLSLATCSDWRCPEGIVIPLARAASCRCATVRLLFIGG